MKEQTNRQQKVKNESRALIRYISTAPSYHPEKEDETENGAGDTALDAEDSLPNEGMCSSIDVGPPTMKSAWSWMSGDRSDETTSTTTTTTTTAAAGDCTKSKGTTMLESFSTDESSDDLSFCSDSDSSVETLKETKSCVDAKPSCYSQSKQQTTKYTPLNARFMDRKQAETEVSEIHRGYRLLQRDIARYETAKQYLSMSLRYKKVFIPENLTTTNKKLEYIHNMICALRYQESNLERRLQRSQKVLEDIDIAETMAFYKKGCSVTTQPSPVKERTTSTPTNSPKPTKDSIQRGPPACNKDRRSKSTLQKQEKLVVIIRNATVCHVPPHDRGKPKTHGDDKKRVKKRSKLYKGTNCALKQIFLTEKEQSEPGTPRSQTDSVLKLNNVVKNATPPTKRIIATTNESTRKASRLTKSSCELTNQTSESANMIVSVTRSTVLTNSDTNSTHAVLANKYMTRPIGSANRNCELNKQTNEATKMTGNVTKRPTESNSSDRKSTHVTQGIVETTIESTTKANRLIKNCELSKQTNEAAQSMIDVTNLPTKSGAKVIAIASAHTADEQMSYSLASGDKTTQSAPNIKVDDNAENITNSVAPCNTTNDTAELEKTSGHIDETTDSAQMTTGTVNCKEPSEPYEHSAQSVVDEKQTNLSEQNSEKDKIIAERDTNLKHPHQLAEERQWHGKFRYEVKNRRDLLVPPEFSLVGTTSFPQFQVHPASREKEIARKKMQALEKEKMLLIRKTKKQSNKTKWGNYYEAQRRLPTLSRSQQRGPQSYMQVAVQFPMIVS